MAPRSVVLIGRDGRVRVGDFGLARSASDVVAPVEHVAAPRPILATRTGARVGTPAYMAPEQWDGKPADERTDIFGFSVALFEALYGVRPFEGDEGADADALVRRMRGEAIADPAGARVPRWLRRIVVRGLRVDRGARWPSMRPMLDALERGPFVTPRRAGVLALSLAVVPIAMLARRPTLPPVAQCTGAEAAWGEVWSTAERDAVRDAFGRTLRPGAARAFEQVDRALVGLRARWIAMRTDACEATRVRGEQSDAVLDARMECLDDRRKEVAALARALAEADADGVDRASIALGALGALGALDACANAKALASKVAPPTDASVRARIDALETELADVRALHWLGKYRRALDEATPIAREAVTIGHAPLLAQALLAKGDAEQRLLELDDARRDLHEAASQSMEARDDALAADAWILLVRVDGSLRAKPREGELWARYAEAALKRLGGDDEREATRLRNLATMEWGDDHVRPEGLAQLRRARTLYERSEEPLRTYYLANVDETMGAAAYLSGRLDEALALYRGTELARTGLFGRDHPAVAAALGNEGDCLLGLGRLDEALANWEEAGSILRASGGEPSWWRTGRAAVLRAKGEFAKALDDDTQALAAVETSWGKDALACADACTGQGLDLLGLARASDAIAPLERALALREKAAVRADLLAETRFALARALLGAGRDRVRALGLAKAAEDAMLPFAQLYGATFARRLAEIDAWLARAR